jgi:hypothetical protein
MTRAAPAGIVCRLDSSVRAGPGDDDDDDDETPIGDPPDDDDGDDIDEDDDEPLHVGLPE